MKNKVRIFLIALLLASAKPLVSQPVYFADGQHGGVYGHYPFYVTQFLVDQLNRYPDWKINLEIEPETWDVVQTNTPSAYAAFSKLFADQSVNGRIEYVNPEYGQSYLWNVTGESIIRQFDYGIRKVRQHFPGAVFTAYSSEEPMFTSALPEILKSFGFKYAVLKNPNTCWGGYTRAFGGELVNWLGPDGTSILTVPRYAIESLQPGSTWQTIAWNNSLDYRQAASAAGIRKPVGMCFQDAGWKNGPWLGDHPDSLHPLIYETWRHYFERVAAGDPAPDWHFSQEDVLVSLVWGAQILQQIAQEVRTSENQLTAAEKMATLSEIYDGTPWPQASLDEAWRTLLLSEHHDCWIVPYNLKDGRTWAEHVSAWTAATRQTSRDVTEKSIHSLDAAANSMEDSSIRIFNILGTERTGLASVRLAPGWSASNVKVLDQQNQQVPSQFDPLPDTPDGELLFSATVPAMGYATYHLRKGTSVPSSGATALIQSNGLCRIDTDLYTLKLNPKKGGIIESLYARQLNREFVDVSNPRSFDEIRGYFYREGVYRSSADEPAQIQVLENGPLRVRVAIHGTIDSQPFTKILTLIQGQRIIDFNLQINWNDNPGIGSPYSQTMSWQPTDNVKAFYDDRFKLSALFPLNLPSQQIYKNAPFDVTHSTLTNTFFTTWDGIKNNLILNWVDILDAADNCGLALFTDHTTSYQHGANDPLGLTLQYSGVGLWGRNYRLTGPTQVHYALVPHAGKWDQAGIWSENDGWNAPLMATVIAANPAADTSTRSLLDVSHTGWEISAAFLRGHDLYVRVFNAEGDAQAHQLAFDGVAERVQLVELNGRVIQDLSPLPGKAGESLVSLSLPRFGIRTIKFCNAHAHPDNSTRERQPASTYSRAYPSFIVASIPGTEPPNL